MQVTENHTPQFRYRSIRVPNFVANKIGNCFTEFVRYDLDWDYFTNKVIEKYENIPKVNLHILGCSSGEEAWQTAMLLIKKLGEDKAQKFFPIHASDIDATQLKNSQQGIIKPSEDDVVRLNTLLGKDSSRFFELDNQFEPDDSLMMNVCTGQIKPILRDKVIFKHADAESALQEVGPDNNIILCRNFWPYLRQDEQLNLARHLSDKLGNNSICVIGRYDRKDTNLPAIFSNLGLKNTLELNSCYEKPASETKKACLSNPEFLMNIYANRK
jgi:chemotaxis methyl-accepting protein methylase